MKETVESSTISPLLTKRSRNTSLEQQNRIQVLSRTSNIFLIHNFGESVHRISKSLSVFDVQSVVALCVPVSNDETVIHFHSGPIDGVF